MARILRTKMGHGGPKAFGVVVMQGVAQLMDHDVVRQMFRQQA